MDQPHDTAGAADPLAALRAATGELHERLDEGLPIGKPDASLDDYAAHLALLRAWLAPLHAWQAGYADGPQADARFDAGARLALIDADLAEPGMPASAGPGAPQRWPAAAGAAWRWGVAYVVEGSQLGGAVLYGRLHERLAPHPLRYLRGDAAGPGPRWRAFMQALREHVRTPGEIADARAGACAAFERILALREGGVADA
ncbi:biliverdin-producing heme oxygenase [uncultured Massilia sp.]|uniref:biliverdin-producing heme oxygenase n=1 Tax=uncultured Massilia sp. TaxID=169973 RepID=UPI0025D65330|nr:biliverdin-producing heme oxygenase [uncultured Massilia sp.]